MVDGIRHQAFGLVCDAWVGAGVDYGIANGYDLDRDVIGRDVDVMVAETHLERAWRLAGDVLEGAGWSVCRDQRPWAYWIFAFRSRNGQWIGLEIDLLPRLQSGVCLFQSGPSERTFETASTGWRVDPRSGFIKKVVMQLVAGNVGKLCRAGLPLQIDDRESEAVADDNRLTELAERLESISTPAELKEFGAKFKRRMSVRALASPGALFSAATFGATRILGLNLLPKPVIPILFIEVEHERGLDEFLSSLAASFEDGTFLKPEVRNLERSPFPLAGVLGIGVLANRVSSHLHLWWIAARKSVRLFPFIYINHPRSASLNGTLVSEDGGRPGSLGIQLTDGPTDQALHADCTERGEWVTIGLAGGAELAAKAAFEEFLVRFHTPPPGGRDRGHSRRRTQPESKPAVADGTADPSEGIHRPGAKAERSD